VRSILLRLQVKPAGKLSHCRHKKAHEIRKGELRFVVKAPGVATGEKGYCAACAAEMIEQARGDLVRLEEELN
jgi:hypothetical protein